MHAVSPGEKKSVLNVTGDNGQRADGSRDAAPPAPSCHFRHSVRLRYCCISVPCVLCLFVLSLRARAPAITTLFVPASAEGREDDR
jgi:hypothetical protein